MATNETTGDKVNETNENADGTDTGSELMGGLAAEVFSDDKAVEPADSKLILADDAGDGGGEEENEAAINKEIMAFPEIGKNETFPEFRARVKDLLARVYALDKTGKLGDRPSLFTKIQGDFNSVDDIFSLTNEEALAPDSLYDVTKGVTYKGRTIFTTNRDGQLARSLGINMRCELGKDTDEIELSITNSSTIIGGIRDFIPEELGVDKIIVVGDTITYTKPGDRRTRHEFTEEMEQQIVPLLDSAIGQYEQLMEKLSKSE